jgi:hypothetical protein
MKIKNLCKKLPKTSYEVVRNSNTFFKNNKKFSSHGFRRFT